MGYWAFLLAVPTLLGSTYPYLGPLGCRPPSSRINALRLSAAGEAFPSERQILEAQKAARQAAVALKDAVAREDYISAAALKLSLAELRAADPVFTLRTALKNALDSEDYNLAQAMQTTLAKLRAQRPSLLWRDEMLVLASSGRALHILDAHGASRLVYAAPDAGVLRVPAWAPDGEAVAVSEVFVGPDGSRKSRVVVVSASDGTVRATCETPQPVFYLAWVPSSGTVTFLHMPEVPSMGGPTLLLGALDVPTGESREIIPGGPLFFNMDAEGTVLMHNGFSGEVSAFELRLGGDDHPRCILSTAPGRFRSPCLLPALGNRMRPFAAYVESEGHIVCTELTKDGDGKLVAGQRTTIHYLAKNTEYTSLVASTDGTKLAVLRSHASADAPELLLLHAATPASLVSAAPNSGGPARGLIEALADATAVAAGEPEGPAASDGGDGGEGTPGSPEGRAVHALPPASERMATLCAFFSPDSTKLLCLDADIGAGAEDKPSGLRSVWTVWELSREPGAFGDAPVRRTFDSFQPSEHFLRSIVPFADQFATTLTPWSPDSTAFCFVAADGTTRVQYVDIPPRGGSTSSNAPSGLGELDSLAITPAAEILDGPEADLAIWSPC